MYFQNETACNSYLILKKSFKMSYRVIYFNDDDTEWTLKKVKLKNII